VATGKLPTRSKPDSGRFKGGGLVFLEDAATRAAPR
jgi:hypothetical protein